jgi:CubicO group peptidase (beta-lactamase class C family)
MNAYAAFLQRWPTTLSVTCFALVILVLVSIPARVAAQREKNSSALDALFSPLIDAKSPSVAVLVRKNNQTVFERGYGARELRSFAKIDARTNFRLASCTKQFTAMSIMLLVHDGKLRYDQTLTQLFSGFPAYGQDITVRHLLNHTSGLLDYEDLMAAAEKQKGARIWDEIHQIQDAEVLKLLEQERAGKFAPGTRWSYSNSGYVILGLIVAKVSGQSFPEFLEDRIFAPLEMRNTLAYVKGKGKIANRAYGHSKEGRGWRETDQSSTSATLGDGGIYSSLEDLAKWDEALARHSLLSETEMQPALTAATLAGGSQPQWPASSDRAEGTPVSYGFGWFLDPYRGHQRMWHYGDTMGFHSYIARFPADSLAVIVLCNRTDLDPEALALKTADEYLDTKN